MCVIVNRPPRPLDYPDTRPLPPTTPPRPPDHANDDDFDGNMQINYCEYILCMSICMSPDQSDCYHANHPDDNDEDGNLQINYCGPNTNCNNHPGFFECNEDDCKDGYTNWQANKGIKDGKQIKVKMMVTVTVIMIK